MARKLKYDMVLFVATVLLVFLGVVMVYSASAVLAMQKYGEPYLFLKKQVLWAVLGLAGLSLLMKVDYRTYRQPAFIMTFLAVVGLLLCLVLSSAPINSARRWFSIAGLGIQPSELAKLCTVFFVAWILERRMDRVNELHALVPIAVVVVTLMLLILAEPDFGTAMTIALIAAVMLFAAGLYYRYILGAILVLAPIVTFLIVSSSYRLRRLKIFWDPYSDPLGDGFQIIQSFIAIGTGGVTGRGLMHSIQKLFYLPEAHTDFIFSVIAEELGLVGTLVGLACFCVIAWRGLRVTVHAPDRFGAFVALGLTTMVAAQAFVNISVVLGLLPTKGISLPLISSGGSSLLINLAGLGVLLNVSQHVPTEA